MSRAEPNVEVRRSAVSRERTQPTAVVARRGTIREEPDAPAGSRCRERCESRGAAVRGSKRGRESRERATSLDAAHCAKRGRLVVGAAGQAKLSPAHRNKRRAAGEATASPRQFSRAVVEAAQANQSPASRPKRRAAGEDTAPPRKFLRSGKHGVDEAQTDKTRARARTRRGSGRGIGPPD